MVLYMAGFYVILKIKNKSSRRKNNNGFYTKFQCDLNLHSFDSIPHKGIYIIPFCSRYGTYFHKFGGKPNDINIQGYKFNSSC